MEEQAGPWQVPTSESRVDSSNSTPYESASCSPRSSTDRSTFSYYSVNTPAYPVKITCDRSSLLPGAGTGFVIPSSDETFSEGIWTEEFEFSSRFSETDPLWSLETLSTADELFCNGRIRPLWNNGEDSTLTSSHYEPDPDDDDDDDDHYDFKSSADYKFSTSSTLHSSASVINTIQRGVGYVHSGPFHDENSMRLQGLMYGVKEEDTEETQRTKGTVQKWKEVSARPGREDMMAKQVMMGKPEESRGRRTCGNKEGGVRRTRSLSPLRVFHMDDELPKQSFESDRSFYPIEGDGGNEGKRDQGTKGTSYKERRFTLKELLHSSSRTEHMPSQKQQGKLQSKADMEMEMKRREGRASRWKSSPKQAVGNKSEEPNHAPHQRPVQHQESMSPHSLHYKSPQKVQVEQRRQQTFLPYRRGLLGCLGFSSRSHHSVAGIQSLGIEAVRFKSGVMRRSTR